METLQKVSLISFVNWAEKNQTAVDMLVEEFASKGKDVKKGEEDKSLPVNALKVLCQWKQQKKIPARKKSYWIFWCKYYFQKEFFQTHIIFSHARSYILVLKIIT